MLKQSEVDSSVFIHTYIVKLFRDGKLRLQQALIMATSQCSLQSLGPFAGLRFRTHGVPRLESHDKGVYWKENLQLRAH